MHAEQGFGDTLQFVRFVPLAAQRAARVILEVQPQLVPLIAPAAQNGASTWSPKARRGPRADLQIPLLSLPLALGTTFETIPSRTPYLTAPSAYRRKWRGSLGGHAKRKIGIAWSGRIQKQENRAMPLAALDPLFALDGIDWIVLQPDLGEADRAALSAHPRAKSIHCFDARIGDFADTAAVIERLDAVVSVDTSIAHLAGRAAQTAVADAAVCGRLALVHRHRRQRQAEPVGIPALHLVRQPQPGAWSEVVAAVALALRDA